MSDLHCPVRVHLAPSDDRIALVLERAGTPVARVAAELRELADEYRGEAIRVEHEDPAALARQLVGRPASHLEGDGDGWRAVPP